MFPLFVLAISENFIASTWNVDPYHEGALFPTAVGLAEGLSPFREISQQYGFLGPLIVSLPLRFFGNYLIVERIFGFLLILSIALFMYMNLRALTTNSISGLITLVWLTISPVWSWSFGSSALSGGYWPNHIGTLLVLIALYIFPMSNLGASVAGFLVLISSQARAEFIFVWIFMTISILIKVRAIRLYWVCGSCLAALSTYFYLSSNQALGDWFQQTFVVWTMDPPGVPEINLNFFIFNMVNFFGVSILGLALWLTSKFFARRISSQWLAISAQAVLVMGFLLVPSWFNFHFKIGNYDLMEAVRYIFRNTLFAYVNFSMVLGAILLFLNYKKHKSESASRIDTFNGPLLMLLSAAFGVLSLFHNFNPDYSQMTWPIFGLVLFLLITLSNSEKFNIYTGKNLRVFAIGLLLASHVTFFSHVTSQTVPYKTPMLFGLYGESQDRVQNLDSAFKIVAQNVVKGKMLMICQTGLLSTSEKGFLGSDKWTWNQQPSKMLSGRIENLQVGSTILACQLNREDSSRVKNLLKGKYIEVVNRNSNFTLYRVVRSIS